MPTDYRNPFDFKAASDLSEDDIIKFYIDDYNYSRLILSKDNVFIIGERGSGKTMNLKYNSIAIQIRKAILDKITPTYDYIGIHIPCDNTLFHKQEYLIEPNETKAWTQCEHYFAITMLHSICKSLGTVEVFIKAANDNSQFFYSEFDYLFNITLRHSTNPYFAVCSFLSKELEITQNTLNSNAPEDFYKSPLRFRSHVMPFIEILKQLAIFSDSHFMLMIDDAHDLNEFQIKILNSLIAYRERKDFSFKVATASVNRPIQHTSVDSAILNIHDFTKIELEKDFQNAQSDFGKLAERIVKRRLEFLGLDITPYEFFPENPAYTEGIEKHKEEAVKLANEKYPDGDKKQIGDFVYKYKRALYFKNRHDRANNPPYSGFQTIVDISTGVIRNLLAPCSYMFDAAISESKDNKVLQIPNKIQTAIINEQSKLLWEQLNNGLNKEIPGCTSVQARQIHNLFENLMILFKERLERHKSEPCAISFSISGMHKSTDDIYQKVLELLKIAQKAQILYTRIGVAKSNGKHEPYYIPNRMLLPLKGLDPHGQYARVSIPATDLWLAAEKNNRIPAKINDDETSIPTMNKLFTDEHFQ